MRRGSLSSKTGLRKEKANNTKMMDIEVRVMHFKRAFSWDQCGIRVTNIETPAIARRTKPDIVSTSTNPVEKL